MRAKVETLRRTKGACRGDSGWLTTASPADQSSGRSRRRTRPPRTRSTDPRARLIRPPPSAAGTTSHGFLAKRGVLTPIDHPRATTVPATPDGQAGTATTGINDRGEILGAYEGRDRAIRNFVRDRKGRFDRLEEPPGGSEIDEYVDLNNGGEMVGFHTDDQGVTTTGFLRTKRGRFIDAVVPGSVIRATGTAVLGINNRGQMVGSYIDADGAYHGFLRERNGRAVTLPEAPGAQPAMGGTQPSAINDRGQIVGLASDARGGSRGFLLERGVLTMLDGRGAVYTRALDISNGGEIVGDHGIRAPLMP
jgi:uncharacterized membrane protein